MTKHIARWLRFWLDNTTPEDRQQRDPETGKYTITTTRRRAACMQDSTRLEWIKWLWRQDWQPVIHKWSVRILAAVSTIAVTVIGLMTYDWIAKYLA